jgi:hypothetical protein
VLQEDFSFQTSTQAEESNISPVKRSRAMTYKSAYFTAAPSRKLAVIQGQTSGSLSLVFFFFQIHTENLFIHSYYTCIHTDSSSDCIHLHFRLEYIKRILLKPAFNFNTFALEGPDKSSY